MGLLRDLGTVDLDDQVRSSNREYRDGNMSWWRQRLKDRFGVSIPDPKKDDNAVGHTVRVGSPEQHYHYPIQQTGLPGWVKSAALVLGGGLIGAASLYYLNRDKPTPVENKDATLNPGGVKIVVTDHKE